MCNQLAPMYFVQLGMMQHYYLGEFFYQRYTEELKSKYLFNNYTRTQIYVRSTDVDRTLMSAQCQLSGLFKPDEEQVCVCVCVCVCVFCMCVGVGVCNSVNMFVSMLYLMAHLSVGVSYVHMSIFIFQHVLYLCLWLCVYMIHIIIICPFIRSFYLVSHGNLYQYTLFPQSRIP